MFLSGFPKLFNVWDSWRLVEGGAMVTGLAFCKDVPLRKSVRLCIWSLCCDGALQHPFLSTQAHSLRQTAQLVEAAQGSILASERCCPKLAAGKWLYFRHVITLDLNHSPSLSLQPSFLLFHPSLPNILPPLTYPVWLRFSSPPLPAFSLYICPVVFLFHALRWTRSPPGF